jgi:HEAT repeat protein
MVVLASQYRAELAALAPEAIAEYLTQHSGLPGPRANLTLLDVAGDLLPEPLIWQFVDEPDEYLACCGTVGLGRLILAADDRAALITRLGRAAADDRWRVREAAAIAVQRIGDVDAHLLRTLVAGWVGDPDPVVVRAGIAAICEPRLLRDPLTAAAALQACQAATEKLAAIPAPARRSEATRILRKGLAYCWSVAVAASPEQGLRQFFAIDTGDADLAWVVKQNLIKQRMKRLL